MLIGVLAAAGLGFSILFIKKRKEEERRLMEERRRKSDVPRKNLNACWRNAQSGGNDREALRRESPMEGCREWGLPPQIIQPRKRVIQGNRRGVSTLFSSVS